ncbi:MAG: pilus assembly protein CpaE [Acidithiobacillus sp.]
MSVEPAARFEQATGPVVVLALSRRPECLAWIRHALDGLATVLPVNARQNEISAAIGQSGAALLIVDFGAESDDYGTVFDSLHQAFPDLRLIGIAPVADQRVLLAAMRAQAVDFVQSGGAPEPLRMAVGRILSQTRQRRARAGKLVVVAGSVGSGCTTLACNLAASLSALHPQSAELLLDFGTPVGTAATYMGIAPRVAFAEAVRNLERCDKTYLDTAIAQNTRGLGVLPLFAAARDLRGLNLSEVFQMLAIILSMYHLVVADIGGAVFSEVSQYLLQAADEIVVVCDQSVAGILEGKKIAANLREKIGTRLQASVVVNHYEAALGVDAVHVGEALGLPLLGQGIVPERRLPLIQAMNGGTLAFDALPKDAYSRAVQQCAGLLAGRIWPDSNPEGTHGATGWLRRWRTMA